MLLLVHKFYWSQKWVMSTSNPNSRDAEAGNCWILDQHEQYSKVVPREKNGGVDMVVHACNPNIWGWVEAGRLGVQGSPQLHGTLSKKNKNRTIVIHLTATLRDKSFFYCKSITIDAELHKSNFHHGTSQCSWVLHQAFLSNSYWQLHSKFSQCYL